MDTDPAAVVARWRACWHAPAHLAVVHGPDAGWAVPLTSARVSVGRAPSADLTLADPSVSRLHACVAPMPDGERYLVRVAAPSAVVRPRRRGRRRPGGPGDTGGTGSTGGRERVRRVRRRVLLRVGDALLVGSTRLEVRGTPEPDDAGVPRFTPPRRPPRQSRRSPPPATMAAGDPGGRATSSVGGRWRSLLALLPMLGMLPLLLAGHASRWWLVGAIGVGAVGAVVVALVGPRRRPPAPPGADPPDPAATAVWAAGVGALPALPHAVEALARAGGPVPPAPPEGTGVLVHGGAAGLPLRIGAEGVAVVGPNEQGLARWLEVQRPGAVRRAVPTRGALEPGPWPVIGARRRLGVSPAWVAAVHHAVGDALPDGALVRVLDPNPARVARAWLDPVAGLPVHLGPGPASGLDLAEHGPHALVAGTTGSGKSELLQSWVLALALGHAPRDLTMLLVDYKGGATFGVAAGLPHCVGLLTDLDAAASARALTALRHELRRRERLLAAAGARDRADLLARGGHLGRLVVVVDEVRALVEDDAARLADLTAVATLGRSLGLHLVLATQRPAGVLEPQLRANLPLRVCLRVLDATDSLDVVGRGDASTFTRPGQAVVTGTAHDGVTQLGRLTAPDAARVVAAVREAAERVRRARRGDLLTGHRPWTPALPAQVGRSAVRAPLLLDVPEETRHAPWRWAGGRLLVSGPPRSGRSTALRALVGDALRAGRPCHVISREPWPRWTATGRDSGHVIHPGLGTTVTTAEPDRLVRLLMLLAQGSDPGATLVLDDTEAVLDAVDGATRLGTGQDLIATLLQVRDDMAFVVGTAHRWAPSVATHLTLHVRDAGTAAMLGIPRALVDPQAPPGRGVLLDRGVARLAQVVVDDLPLGTAAESAGTEPLLRLAPVPAHVRGPVTGAPAGVLAVGRGGDDAGPVGAVLEPGRPWLVVGPPGSGRTTALGAVADAARAAGLRVVRVDGDESHHPDRSGPHDRPGPTGDPRPTEDARPTDDAEEVLLVDDADQLDTAESVALVPRLRGRVVVATTPAALLTAFQGVLGGVREARTVLALGGHVPSHAHPGTPRLPLPVPPGRALLVTPRGTLALQVAQPP